MTYYLVQELENSDEPLDYDYYASGEDFLIDNWNYEEQEPFIIRLTDKEEFIEQDILAYGNGLPW